MHPIRLGALAVLATALVTPATARPLAEPTDALLAYVRKADASYKWTVRHDTVIEGAQVAELRLVSQTWRDVPWRHRVFVLKPNDLRRPKQAVLFIAGGSWRESYDQPPSSPRWPAQLLLAARAAQQAGTCLVMVEQVPFQPMFGKLREDALIAYSFSQWLTSGDDTWPLLFPMVKSAVRTMDAAQEFLAREWDVEVSHFTVSGASKRGWTTWLTGAADPRVNAIAPMVIDVLNMAPQMKHQLAAWGDYSEQIGDYTARGLPGLAESPEGRRLLAMVDPYSYRRMLTMPKLLLIGTNDRYWPLDACNLYWDDLVGAKYLCYVPNNGHGLSDFERILGALSGLTRAASGEQPMPTVAWQFEAVEGGHLSLRVFSEEVPTSVRVWRAESETRDFRTARWSDTPVRALARFDHDGREMSLYMMQGVRPGKGWRAFFAEMEFAPVQAATGAPPLRISTNVRILRADQPEDF